MYLQVEVKEDKNGNKTSKDMSTTENIYSYLDAMSKTETGAAMSKALG